MIVILPASSTIHAIIDVWIPITACLFLLFVQASDRCSRTAMSDLKWNKPCCISIPKKFSRSILQYTAHRIEIQKIFYLLLTMKRCVYNTPSGILEYKIDWTKYEVILNPDKIELDTYFSTIKNRGECGIRKDGCSWV